MVHTINPMELNRKPAVCTCCIYHRATGARPYGLLGELTANTAALGCRPERSAPGAVRMQVAFSLLMVVQGGCLRLLVCALHPAAFQGP
jgi:hypothetical protein